MTTPRKLRIDELWAWVASDDEGEGLMAAPVPGLGENMLTVPLVGADRDRMLSFEPIVRQMCNHFGTEAKLIRLTNRIDVETITPVTQEKKP